MPNSKITQLSWHQILPGHHDIHPVNRRPITVSAASITRGYSRSDTISGIIFSGGTCIWCLNGLRAPYSGILIIRIQACVGARRFSACGGPCAARGRITAPRICRVTACRSGSGQSGPYFGRDGKQLTTSIHRRARPSRRSCRGQSPMYISRSQ